MNFVSDGIKEVVYILNQPLVKDTVKKVVSVVTFAFGLVELYDIYQIIQGGELSGNPYSNYPKWVQVAYSITIICSKISLILSAGTSYPGIFIISTMVGSVFSTEQLASVFGPNTIFEVNPWHPRHIVTIAAVILALPGTIEWTYQTVHWLYREIRQYRSSVAEEEEGFLSDIETRIMTLFNTITSRPLLHLGNQFAHYFN